MAAFARFADRLVSDPRTPKQPFIKRDLSRFFHLRAAISGKSNRERVSGKRDAATAVGAISVATVSLWAPNWEGA